MAGPSPAETVVGTLGAADPAHVTLGRGVIPGLGPRIHVSPRCSRDKTWMAGPSPAKTVVGTLGAADPAG